jgi:hypothetical protein
MLVLHQLLYVLFTLHGIFMHFLELTINKMPQCKFLFSAVFVFQKSYTGNILEIGRNKSQSSDLSDMKTDSKGETKQAQEAAAPWGGAAYPMAAPGPGVGPQVPSDITPPPINSLHRKNPMGLTSIHEKYCKPPPS